MSDVFSIKAPLPKLLLTLLIAFFACFSSLASAVTECDRQAGHGLDPDGVVPGISRSGMDMAAAEKACRAAVAEYPFPPTQGRPAIGLTATTTLVRSDYGLGMFAPFIADEVNLTIDIEAIDME